LRVQIVYRSAALSRIVQHNTGGAVTLDRTGSRCRARCERSGGEAIFEPFYQSRAATHEHAGSGLGLAIAKGFVEANGGRIWVDSTPGQGSAFVVELPMTTEAR